MIKISVHGKPAPQGSKTRNRHGAIYDDSKDLKAWREAIRHEAQKVMTSHGYARISGAAEVHITFRLARPAGHFGTGRNAGELRRSAPPYPVGKRDDSDKLTRAVFDGLTAGGVWADDGQVVHHDVWKVYAQPWEPPGADITVEELTG